MQEWERPHWSGKPQPKQDTRPRLRPNAFARFARGCARQHGVVIAMLFLLSAIAASFAAVTLRIDPAARPQIELDQQTLAARDALARSFPNVDSTFVARIEASDPAAARAAAVAAAGALAARTDLFESAFVPGTGDFYEKYGILFRAREDVEARVDLVLRMQPLYHALGSSPDIAGLAALVTEIGRAVSQGRSPPGLSSLLLAVSDAVESEIASAPRPIDWPRLAGLSPPMDSTRWFVIATPVAPRLAEAAALAAVTAQGPGTDWYFPPGALERESNMIRDLIVPAMVAAMITLTILVMGLGAVKFAVPAVLTVAATLCLTAGAAALIAPGLDAVSWSFAAACMAPAYLFSIVLILAHVQSRLRGSTPLAALMLASQRRGPLLLTLAIISAIFWLTWLPRQLPSLEQTATIAAFGIAIAFVAAMTMVPAALAAFDRGGAIELHWVDVAVARPHGHNLRNGLQVTALVLLAVSVFCGVFLPGLRFGDAASPAVRMAALDTPAAQDGVHFIVASGEPARRMVESLAKLPETGSIRTVEQFLPAEADAKLLSLQQLDGLFTDVPASRDPAGPIGPLDSFGELERGLRQIAEDPATAPDLKEAAHRLRRAFGLFTNPEQPPPARVMALEEAIFSGLGDLSWTANGLARLQVPQIDDLDEGLRRRFVSEDGQWRIEVLPKPGVSRLNFAAAMRKFSPEASGAPIEALTRNEILHHETALAGAFAFAAAAMIVLLYFRNLRDAALALLPVLLGIFLASAAMTAMGKIVVPSAIGAAMTAAAVCLSSSIILVLRARHAGGPAQFTDTGFRAALLPPLAIAGTVAPLAISASPGVSAFGYVSTLFLAIAVSASLLMVPQISGWLDTMASRRTGAA